MAAKCMCKERMHLVGYILYPKHRVRGKTWWCSDCGSIIQVGVYVGMYGAMRLFGFMITSDSVLRLIKRHQFRTWVLKRQEGG